MEYRKTNYLEHHGIQGQKWGVRNGPPYPLKPGMHSAAEKRAGLSGVSESDKNTKTNYSKSSRTPTAADSVDFEQTKYFLDSKIKNIHNCGFKTKSKPSDIKSDSAAVNPKYREHSLSNRYKMNCTNCISAYALRRMGLDVEAQPLSTGRDIQEMNLMFKNCLNSKHTNEISFNTHSDTSKSVREGITKQIEELCGEDAGVGFIRVQGAFCGHVFNWEKMDDGRVIFVDSQSNNVDDKVIENYFKWLSQGKYLEPHAMVTRLDNCYVDTMAINNAVRNHKERQ